MCLKMTAMTSLGVLLGRIGKAVLAGAREGAGSLWGSSGDSLWVEFQALRQLKCLRIISVRFLDCRSRHSQVVQASVGR